MFALTTKFMLACAAIALVHVSSQAQSYSPGMPDQAAPLSGGSATSSNTAAPSPDPFVERRETVGQAKADYKAQKNTAKEQYKAEKKEANAKLKEAQQAEKATGASGQ